MKRYFFCLSLIVVLSAVSEIMPRSDSSQPHAPDAPGDFRFTVETDLMEVRTVVTDRNGQMVTGLKKEDFELFVNNTPQNIDHFSVSSLDPELLRQALEGSAEHDTGITPTIEKDRTARLELARERLREPPARTTLLFVDNVHLSLASLNQVKKALRHFVNDQMTDSDLVALANSHSLGVVQQFTRDRRLLQYAVEQMRYGRTGQESAITPRLAIDVINNDLTSIQLGVDILRAEENIPCPCSYLLMSLRDKAYRILSDASYSRENTLAILEVFIDQMIDLPGQRMIVLFSDGFTMYDPSGELRNDQIQAAINRAANSGVAVYSINAEGVQPSPLIDASRQNVSFWDLESLMQQCPMDYQQADEEGENYYSDQRCMPPLSPSHLQSAAADFEFEKLNAMRMIAEYTGGELFPNTNDLNSALVRAFDANRFYYVLSYYLPKQIDTRRFQNFRIQVCGHPEYTVRTSRGFSPQAVKRKAEEALDQTPQQRLLRAMGSPLPVTDLGVSAHADFIETETDDKNVSLVVTFEGDRFQYRDLGYQAAVNLDIISVFYDASGKQADGISASVEGKLSPGGIYQAQTSGYRYARRLSLPPGVYHARIGVKEEGTDRMGTASTWIEVPDMKKNRPEMSSIVLSNPLDMDPLDEEGIKVGAFEQIKVIQGIPMYAPDDIFYYFFRVHRGQQQLDSGLSVKREVFSQGAPVIQEQWQEISAETRETDSKGWVEIDGEIDIDEFDPGVYELRVSVKDDLTGQIAERSSVFGIF
jgi:VWFA-related protein